MSETIPFVAILMGSESDLPTLQGAVDVLDSLHIPCEVRVRSAHRTPDQTREYVADAEARGCAVFIAAAGMAAHLAGAIAAQTTKPVIGIPIDAGPLKGIDALLSTAQMPAGIPVATVAIGKAGAKNAGYLAAQILAISSPALAARLREDRSENARSVLARDEALQRRLGERAN
jgi:5-(carboxyamino)imidazole ribonucleotide mutase